MAFRTSSRCDVGSDELHLHLRGPLIATLRQQWALLMAAGNVSTDVDVNEGTELDLPTLRLPEAGGRTACRLRNGYYARSRCRYAEVGETSRCAELIGVRVCL
jgi:hypothetical protein